MWRGEDPFESVSARAGSQCWHGIRRYERREKDLASAGFGAMVETPAAALAVPMLLKHVDFLCIGTNDLTQYTLAAARDDAAVNDYYVDSHVSIMRLLGIILADAGQCSVTLCGELASRESWVPRLLQMGFRTLSVAPTTIPTTKAAIRKVDISELTSATIDNGP